MFDRLLQRLSADNPIEYRYERKFRIDAPFSRALPIALRQHPAGFREIYSPRTVNSIYLDTHDFAFYRANIAGNANRIKVRIRWYGDNFHDANSPQLEFKVRQGMAMCKFVFKLPPITPTTLSIEHLHSIFKTLELGPGILNVLKALRFAVVVHYNRSYFLSFDEIVRATVDEMVTYQRVSPNTIGSISQIRDHSSRILELKFGVNEETTGAQVASDFAFRMTRNSKYVNGIDAFRR